ncbi:MAG: hypothetical protein IID28_09300 [Planctomycetes bacterium]|nr:hypothetical protein [Planctomycetota bacterium]
MKFKLDENLPVELAESPADIRSYPPESCPGITVFRLARQDTPHILAVPAQLSGLLQSEPIDRCLWIVEEHRVRIRR